jgi:hypothetical protein
MIERKKKDSGIELEPDAWERFERAVDAAVKSGPKHRTKQKSAGRIAESREKDSSGTKKKSGRRPSSSKRS